ncbi:CaiB/BaiF CoA transferase family protein [Ramlibacter sp.]|uniref:CaiB/BaiF CoA transferase family protein n=1 Tax=Ramlibacter sp. TaxID=1917967 RepID=UPI003D098631
MTDDSDQHPPLRGTRVIDLGTRVAAPHCATLLAEFGADVIKVEVPAGDPYRRIGTTLEGEDASLSFQNDNRNKRSLTLDLRTEAGLDVFKKLVASADFLVENFRPGTLEGWGLGYDVLQALNPRLILVRVSAYGQTGLYRERTGVALVAYGFAGISYLCGNADSPPAHPGTHALGDYIAGQSAATGALLAHIARARHGKGQVVDATLYESLLRLLDELVPAYSTTGFIREREGASSPHTVPSNHYMTKDGQWVALSTASQDMYVRLCRAMERPDLAERFPTGAARLEGRRELDAVVSAWIAGLSRDEVVQLSERHDFPAGPIFNVRDIVENEHVRSRGTLESVKSSSGKDVTVVATVPRLSRNPGVIEHLGPRLGEHTDAILGELGFTPDRIRELRAARVV